MLLDPKKGKYSHEENETIIRLVNEGIEKGERERETIKKIAEKLNRGYAGIMSHVRKLKNEHSDRFLTVPSNNDNAARLNSWTEAEEEVVIETVNEHLAAGKSLSTAITALEEKLSRTQGAIYQRIYTLRRKQPDRFSYLPAERPRRKRKPEWQTNRPIIRNLDRSKPTFEQPQPLTELTPLNASLQTEEEMIYKAFETRYGKLTREAKETLNQLLRQYGGTHVSITLFTLNEDKAFATVIIDFLAKKIQRNA